MDLRALVGAGMRGEGNHVAFIPAGVLATTTVETALGLVLASCEMWLPALGGWVPWAARLLFGSCLVHAARGVLLVVAGGLAYGRVREVTEGRVPLVGTLPALGELVNRFAMKLRDPVLHEHDD